MSSLAFAVLPNPFLMVRPVADVAKPVSKATQRAKGLVGARGAKSVGKPPTGARTRAKGGAK